MSSEYVARCSVSIAIITLVLLGGLMQTASAQPTTITAYKSQIPVNVSSPYQPSQWTDTQMFTEPTSGITFAVKQNGTGWLFLMIWQQSLVYCYDQYCFGGIELGHLNNTQPMGSPTTPTIMILASTAFKGGVDEFIATGEQTPVSVESEGYTTQSTCGLTVSGSTYTAMCYRPFKLDDASPYDFALGVGSTIEIGFAVGEFSSPGDHSATDMSTYLLTFSGQTYGAAVSSSSTTLSSSSSVTSSALTTTSNLTSTSSTISSSSPSSSSSTTTTSTIITSTSTTSVSTPAQPSKPSVLNYSLELAVIVVGFTLLVLMVLDRYEKAT